MGELKEAQECNVYSKLEKMLAELEEASQALRYKKAGIPYRDYTELLKLRLQVLSYRESLRRQDKQEEMHAEMIRMQQGQPQGGMIS